MVAASASSAFAEPSNDADSQVWTAPGVGTGDDAGASGDSSGGINLSKGGLAAIIVVVVVVSLIGAATAILFFVAKKREWKVREKIRQSARKVVNALTPRRSTFPDSVKNSRSGRTRIADDVPPTPRLQPEDLEKGRMHAKTKDRTRMKEPSKNWSRKL